MLCKQQQIKCHIIPGDTGTALQPLGNKCCVANTWQNWEQKPKVFLSPAPSPTSFHFSHFSEISVTGRQLRKCDFLLIAVGGLWENTLFAASTCSMVGFQDCCSIQQQTGWISGKYSSILLTPWLLFGCSCLKTLNTLMPSDSLCTSACTSEQHSSPQASPRSLTSCPLLRFLC